MDTSHPKITNQGCYVIEVDHYQKFKHDQQVGGDTFYSIRMQDENRTISILSDGLGSGIKASVLSTLTAVMAARFTAGYRDVRHTSELIMKTLPVCSQRKISYATFTIIDIDGRGIARIIEYDNPPSLVIRDNKALELEPAYIEGKVSTRRRYKLKYYQFPILYGDRIICFSDGVSQSGIGLRSFPLGWGNDRVTMLALEYIRNNPFISARDLSRGIVIQAFHNDADYALDDITCGVVYYRKPRELMVVTGPPYDREKDREVAAMLDRHSGLKIVCGGSTANMIARELKREISLDLYNLKPGIPPASRIEGIDLVTEGILTLRRVADLLKEKPQDDTFSSSPAHQVVEMMMDSDIIRFVVGTRINEAYQDPGIPEEIALRRSLIKEIRENLEKIHLKETSLLFI